MSVVVGDRFLIFKIAKRAPGCPVEVNSQNEKVKIAREVRSMTWLELPFDILAMQCLTLVDGRTLSAAWQGKPTHNGGFACKTIWREF